VPPVLKILATPMFTSSIKAQG